MRYLFEDYKEDLKAMQAMVRKLHPAFDDSRDFCLWLVPEYFDDTPAYRYYCPDVTLTDRSGRRICPLPEKAALIARYPYPNKYLFQAGVKYGAKRVYGVPFVFPDRKSLEEIRAVHTDCFCLYPVEPWRDKRPRMLAVHHEFILDWENAAEGSGHWFTISREEILRGPGRTGSTADMPEATALSLFRFRDAVEQHPPAVWMEREFSMEDAEDAEFRTGTTEVRMEPAPYADLLADPCFGFRHTRD